jgi:hypothetical protein
MSNDSVSENQTKVSWSNVNEMKYPMDIMLSLVEKMPAKDMDESLVKLKGILEND